MPYDQHLAERVRRRLAEQPSVEEKRMMGGLTFMVNSKMCVGILNNDLMVRIDPAIHDEALTMRGCREMDFTGRPMKGFVFVDPTGTHLEKDLARWIDLGLTFNARAKASKRKKTAPR